MPESRPILKTTSQDPTLLHNVIKVCCFETPSGGGRGLELCSGPLLDLSDRGKKGGGEAWPPVDTMEAWSHTAENREAAWLTAGPTWHCVHQRVCVCVCSRWHIAPQKELMVGKKNLNTCQSSDKLVVRHAHLEYIMPGVSNTTGFRHNQDVLSVKVNWRGLKKVQSSLFNARKPGKLYLDWCNARTKQEHPGEKSQ